MPEQCKSSRRQKRRRVVSIDGPPAPSKVFYLHAENGEEVKYAGDWTEIYELSRYEFGLLKAALDAIRNRRNKLKEIAHA